MFYPCKFYVVLFSYCFLDIGLVAASQQWKVLQYRLMERSTDGSGVVTVNLEQNGRYKTLEICPNNMTILEANVLCQQLERGTAKSLRSYERAQSSSELVFGTGLKCYGSEGSVDECAGNIEVHSAHRCHDTRSIGLHCVPGLPNLVPNVFALESSVYVQFEPLYNLMCAIEEKCLHPTMIAQYGNWSQAQLTAITNSSQLYRQLLRFSSVIRNDGEAAFLPRDSSNLWQWHACHKHFHSSAEFAHYEIFSPRARSIEQRELLLLSGHKASFCLEDNGCREGIVSFFRCSNNVSITGSQGITPGCSDIYLHDIDCQWIDVTSLPFGRYTFRLVVNPTLEVAESNYHDNGIACELYYLEHYTGLHYCHHVHPYDLW